MVDNLDGIDGEENEISVDNPQYKAIMRFREFGRQLDRELSNRQIKHYINRIEYIPNSLATDIYPAQISRTIRIEVQPTEDHDIHLNMLNEILYGLNVQDEIQISIETGFYFDRENACLVLEEELKISGE